MHEVVAFMQLQVWMPVLTTNRVASVASLQRMAALLASNESSEKKLSVAAKVADSTSALLTSKSLRQAKMFLGLHIIDRMFEI